MQRIWTKSVLFLGVKISMRVIKIGDPDRNLEINNPPMTFECGECGTVFECKGKEYSKGGEGYIRKPSAVCPVCDHEVQRLVFVKDGKWIGRMGFNK